MYLCKKLLYKIYKLLLSYKISQIKWKTEDSKIKIVITKVYFYSKKPVRDYHSLAKVEFKSVLVIKLNILYGINNINKVIQSATSCFSK